MIPEFLLLRLRSMTQELDRLTSGATVKTIGMADVRTLVTPVPPVHEQSAIINWVSAETSRLDALVAEQQRLIELLKEKRQAVISHAVTKGLNPHVRLKPSGMEWLGDVPEHWEVVTLRRCCACVQTGGTPSSNPPRPDLEAGSLWYTPGDFGDSLRLGESARRIASEAVQAGEVRIFPAGSVLVVGIGATLGKVGFSAEAASANQQVNAVVPSTSISGYFLAYSLSAKTEMMRCLSNTSTIGILNQDRTKCLWVALPPLREQESITIALDASTGRLASLVAESQRAIDLLQERRTALISAAVTGQIDVRQAPSE